MGDPGLNWLEPVDYSAGADDVPPTYGDTDLEEIGVTRRSPRAFLDGLAARVEDLMRPGLPLGPRRELLLSAGVLGAVVLAFWLTRWPLAEWPSDMPDLGLYIIHPILWTGVAALAGYGWLRLEHTPPFKPVLTGVAFAAGFLHVIALVVAGAAGSFTDNPVVDWLFDYPFNIVYVVTALASAEIARSYLFEVWRQVGRSGAFASVTVIFALVALRAEEVTPFSSLDELTAVVGGRWIPILAVSILATALVETGGPAGSFAYRIALGGFAWLSPALPDVHWGILAGIGVLLPWAGWKVITAFHERFEDADEGDEDASQLPPGVWVAPNPTTTKPGRTAVKRVWSVAKATLGTVALLSVVVLGLVIVFGSGMTGYRLQVIDDEAMAPAYERGDTVMIEENVLLGKLEVDDVIQIAGAEGTEIRRIVRIVETSDGSRLFFAADDSTSAEQMVTEDQVGGEVVVRLPNVGIPVLWWRD